MEKEDEELAADDALQNARKANDVSFAGARQGSHAVWLPSAVSASEQGAVQGRRRTAKDGGTETETCVKLQESEFTFFFFLSCCFDVFAGYNHLTRSSRTPK